MFRVVDSASPMVTPMTKDATNPMPSSRIVICRLRGGIK
jgi:hypothetical protein